MPDSICLVCGSKDVKPYYDGKCEECWVAGSSWGHSISVRYSSNGQRRRDDRPSINKDYDGPEIKYEEANDRS